MEGNKRRTGQPEQVPRKLRAEAKIVRKFWGVHYRYNSSSLPRKVEAADAYRLCLMCYPDLDMDFSMFNRLTGNVGVKKAQDRNKKVKYYYADPITDLSCGFHGVATGERPLSLNLLNIQGLITQGQNKTKLIGTIMEMNKPGKICLLTETHW